ncbi:Serpentine receptor class alpha-20 [Caenorhabditis elegans]|uniref:Serpentine receptor class alpha-20 n=1 Tax=Caenorhabditis elegans TaxID=6239 RepID=SRA20_CAEEL|nr:Serpentine receptor class alpha-20 [Caenorhabditis elegans]O17844.1 RecName: Full=Serpentine receptor class alpha-20; Short=Protein sra-20 [Caenorhabditis elegans]CAB07600.1 Serpentine receptor class alpha-20 [Caenorhabditis elegans]|eukprot:NP_493216.1 Serpentine receptor class alpha-20 [Caenorhabditis elegans]
MNKTAEELVESLRCASEGLTNALTSITVKVSFVFLATVILLSYYFAVLAIRALWNNNIFSNSTRLILIVCLLNSVVHQSTMMEIRIRQVYRSFVYSSEPCRLPFHFTDCEVELYFYYLTNYFSTYSVFSLTFDRLISYFFPKCYISYPYQVSISLLIIQLVFTLGTYYFGLYGVPKLGYVPICNYAPRLATNFVKINDFRTTIMVFCIIVTIFIYYLNVKSEKQIKRTSYSLGEQYLARENVATSQSVCILIVLQFVCISVSSFGVNYIKSIKSTLSDEEYNKIAPFVVGVTYANLCLPLVIYFKTKLTIRKRRIRIGVMTSVYGDVGEHINRLKKSWE